MEKLKINPLTLSNSNNVKLASKNILDVINFQHSMSEELNRVLLEFNNILPLITKPFDSSQIIDSIGLVEKSSKELSVKINSVIKKEDLNKEISKLKKLIPDAFDPSDLNKKIKKLELIKLPLFDDSHLKKEMENIKKSIPDTFNPSDLKKEINLLKLENENLKKSLSEIKEIKKSVSLVQSEIRSARKALGLEQGQLRILIQNKTEVK